VHTIETLEMPTGREPDVGGSSSRHQDEGPVPVVETLEMPPGRGPDVGGSMSSCHC